MSAHSDKFVSSGPVAEINLSALCENFDILNASAGGAETAAVVKCNAYGLGVAPIATALARRSGCATFFVAYPEEGVALRDAIHPHAPDAKIYVFNGPGTDSLEMFGAARLTPVINTIEQGALWARANPGASAALHVDTGMNRLGAPPESLGEFLAMEDFNIDLFMSHLACASAPSHPMNQRQRELFVSLAERLPGVRRSLAASAGVLMGGDYGFDLTRPGIALYGASPFDHETDQLRPVLRLTAPIVQVRSIKAGETVGYGATFTAPRATTIATVKIGYGDGLPVSGSGKLSVIVHGKRTPLIGRISMDLICIEAPQGDRPPRQGDTVELIGETIGVFEAAQRCSVLPYEMLTGLGGRVVRRYV